MLATRVRAGLLALVVVGVGARARGGADGEERMLRDGFESARPAWSQEQTDATITLLAHDRTNRAAHDGRLSEHFKFTSGVGSSFFYSYLLPKVPVSDDLRLSLFVRANRSGVQIFARVVLPSDIDPETKAPSFLLVPGTIYDNVDRWQRLELIDLRQALERQARVLRASVRRPVKLDGAFVERFVVNLFGGSGETEVFLDELNVGPVAPEMAAAFAAALAPKAAAGAATPTAETPPASLSPAPAPRLEIGAPVRLDRNHLKRRAADGLYHDWVFTGIHAPGADLASLRNAGFDVLIDDLDGDPKRFKEAIERGFLLMPIFGRGKDGELPDAEKAAAAAAAFPFRESVMAWNLGDRLGRVGEPRARLDEVDRARAIISAFRSLPAGTSRLTTGLVDDEFARFSRAPRALDLMGIRSASWASSLSPLDTLQFLRQRRDMTTRTNAEALYWAMLPATPPLAITAAVWGRDVPPAWGFPVVQPEQIRLMTYAALAAGYRGVAFHGDAELTRGSGRAVLLEMAMLNAEIDLFESIIANGADPISAYTAYNPDPPTLPPPGARVGMRLKPEKEMPPIPGMRGAGIGARDKKSVLLIVADYADAAQFQPPQMARNDVKMTVIVPETAQAFQVSPGRVRVLERERYVGGTRFTIPEFDTTALILITTDMAMYERVRDVVNSIRPRAAQMAIEQAELKLAWVTELNGRLAADGHYLIEDKERQRRADNGGPAPTDQSELLAKATENIKAARENLEREDFSGAWDEARRASRPLRILMRGFWENANNAMIRANMDPADVANEELLRTGRAKHKGPPLIVPATASAPLVAFNMLPQHYLWVDWMKNGRFGRNLLPTGSFDDPDVLEKAGWTNVGYQPEEVVAKVTTVPWKAGGKARYLKMSVDPAEGRSIDDLPPFFDYPVAAVRSPAVKIKTGQFLRISVHVQRSYKSVTGAGGIVIRDSIGGEALQFQTTDPIAALTKVVIYRRVPADGEFSVTLGLAGYGEANFDELAIERVEAAPGLEPSDIARLPRPSRPATASPLR